MTIRILMCGGTVDKIYNELNGELTFDESHLYEMLQQARFTGDYELETVMLKDSLDMDDADREKVLRRCKRTLDSKIVIPHGTDTMAETSKVLGQNVGNKTIVLFGAMVPYSFGKSDALFNLGYAMAASSILPSGVYVAMNGQIFDWRNVQKNREIGCFEAV